MATRRPGAIPATPQGRSPTDWRVPSGCFHAATSAKLPFLLASAKLGFAPRECQQPVAGSAVEECQGGA
eukprot:8776087-Alexandrium_andersonii.AAC.1